jgi:hypothetical protein
MDLAFVMILLFLGPKLPTQEMICTNSVHDCAKFKNKLTGAMVYF